MQLERNRQPEASKYLDCSRCVEVMPSKLRARWNCGLLAPSKREGPGFPAPANWGHHGGVCPGYLITLPTVIEAARSKMHWEKGLLDQRYEDEPLTQVLFECIEILVASSADAESVLYNEGK